MSRWALDPHVVHLNHGSYGGCLRSVLAAAAGWREQLETSPMRFFVLDWQRELDIARAALAAFVRAPVERTVFLPGATTGIAIALGSTELTAGDEILLTDHGYRAVRNQVERLARARGLSIVTIPITLPFDPDAVVDAFARAITAKTRLAIVDHITSPTALRLPVERIVPLLRDRGISTIVDGAHAPGQLDLDVAALGASYYVGNCHKWMCAPKGSGFLVTDAHAVPVVTSHGASPEYGPPNRLHAELDWSGTHDPAVHLTVPTAIAEVGAEGTSWPLLRARNHAMVIEMRQRFVDGLAKFAARPAVLAPDDHVGSMVAVPIALPAGVTPLAFEIQLLEAGWEIPIVDWPGGTLVRLSAHLYNHAGEADDLARELHGRGVRVR
jgi:isopenicillin-N epimerase